jgi:polar amino acid transport system permease protein
MDYRFRFDVVTSNLSFLLEGLGMTLLISFLSLVVSVAIGLFIAICRRSSTRWISFPAATYCELFRDTPVLVQLFWVYYVLPVLTGFAFRHSRRWSSGSP